MYSEQLIESFWTGLELGADPRSLLIFANERFGTTFHACRVLSFLSANGTLEPQEQVSAGPFEWVREAGIPEDDQALIDLLGRLSRRVLHTTEPFLVDKMSSTNEEVELWSSLQVELAVVIPLVHDSQRLGGLVLFRDFEFSRFKSREIASLKSVSSELAKKVAPFILKSEVQEGAGRTTSATEDQEFLQEAIEGTDAIFLRVDLQGTVLWSNQRTAEFFGFSPSELKGRLLRDLFHPDEAAFIDERLHESRKHETGFEDEVRSLNHLTQREKVLLLHATFQKLNGGGWSVFGIDVSARADAQVALELQTRKVQALYSVSAAIRGHLDPGAIGNRGLQAVLDASRADAGACFLCPAEDPSRMTLTSQRGFSEAFLEKAQKDDSLINFIRSVSESRQAIVVPSIANDKRISPIFSYQEGMRSAVLVPILVENDTYGALALFSRSEGKFDGSDVLLLSAASGQIGLAARQANLFAAYRRQTRNLLALYRISHELSALKSLPEVFEQAFAILREELGLKRVWLGLLNEGGTLVGTAAFGPGWKRRLVELVVNVEEQQGPLAEVLKTQRPVVVGNPKAFLGKFGLERFFSRFAIQSLALAPLVTRGQVLGVLAAQPGAGVRVNEEELSLLSSIANELASLVNTRRLEDKVIESERMQSTALLAAGIAHNFNNVLQAVLGQASLLEMQKMNPEQVERAAKVITESATRGATVVRQLLSVANLEEARRTPTNINEFLKKEQLELGKLVPNHQTLRLSLKKDLPYAQVDPSHLHRILTVLIKNAVEALKNRGFLIQLFSDSVYVDGKSLHFEAPEGEYVRIGVRDNGIGMDAETKRRCFDPFFSTKNVDPGTGLGLKGEGLGLAAAFALARKNGGRLTVESRLGQGALFSVFLPAAAIKMRDTSVASGAEVAGGTSRTAESPESRKEEGEHAVALDAEEEEAIE